MDELAERLPESRGSRNRNAGPEEDHKGRSHQDREQKISSRNEHPPKNVVPENATLKTSSSTTKRF